MAAVLDVLQKYVGTGSRFGSPARALKAVLEARNGSTEAQAGSTEAQAAPAGQAIYIYTSVLLSLYSDKSTVDQEFCGNWQLFWTYLRSTLELAAVLAVL